MCCVAAGLAGAEARKGAGTAGTRGIIPGTSSAVGEAACIPPLVQSFTGWRGYVTPLYLSFLTIKRQ